jgi:enoyl-CoA hydratase/carnithine racemase
MVQDLFVEVLHKAESVLPRAIEVANDIAQNTSTISTYLMKEMMWRNPGSAEGTHLLDSQIMFQLYDKADKEEGIKSFLEKRSAKFGGSVHKDMPDCVPWWDPIDVEKKRKKELNPKL